LKTVVKAARKLPAAVAAWAAKSDEKACIAESFTESQQTVYAAPIAKGKWAVYIDRLGPKECGKLAKVRVELAGARLANLLNTELK
jgi:hypothetical protein